MHKHYIWRLKLLVPGFSKGICLPDTQTSEIHSYYSVQCFVLLAVEAKKEDGHKHIRHSSFLRNLDWFYSLPRHLYSDELERSSYLSEMSPEGFSQLLSPCYWHRKTVMITFQNAVVEVGGKIGLCRPEEGSLALSQKDPNTSFIFCWLCEWHRRRKPFEPHFIFL